MYKFTNNIKKYLAIFIIILLLLQSSVYALTITGKYNLKIRESVVVYNGSGTPINAKVTPVIANKEDTIYSLLLDEKASTTFSNTKTVDSKSNRTTEFNLTGISDGSQQTVDYEYLLRVNTFDFELSPENVGTDYVYDPSLNIYLQPSVKIESDNTLIINKANEIKNTITESNRNHPYYITKAIFDYIVTHMNYSNDTNYSNKGALNAVQYLVGNCEDYSTFMVALLRASNIPARDITGYRIKVTDGKSDEINLIDSNDYKRHAWVEAYLKGYGWVFFDPTMSSATLKSYPIKDSNGNVITSVSAYAPLLTPDYKNFAKTGDIYIKERIDYNEGVIKASVTKTPASLDSLSFAQQVNYTEFTPYDSISILESLSYSEQPVTFTVQGVRGGIPNSIPNSIVVWTTSDSNVATVKDGVVTFTGNSGNVTITASHNGLTDTVVTSVNPPALSSIKINEVLPTTGTIKLTVTGTYEDNSTQPIASGVTWTSSDETFATVDTDGNVTFTGKDNGTVSITGTYDGKSDTVSVNIPKAAPTLSSIKINEILPTTGTIKLTVTGTYSDNSTQPIASGIIWSSSDNSFATVDTDGNVTFTGKDNGTVSITATYNGKSDTVSVNIPAKPVEVTLSSIKINEVLPTTGTIKLTVTGTYSDNSTQAITEGVTWISSDETFATVDNQGNVTFTDKDNGTVSITATYGGKSDMVTSIIPRVPPALSSINIDGEVISEDAARLFIMATYSDGSTEKITEGITWTISDESIAIIDEQNILMKTGTNFGTFTITAEYQGKTARETLLSEGDTEPTLSSIVINENLPTSGSIQLTVTGTYSDNSTHTITDGITWTSSDESYATVDGNGLVTFTGKAGGTVTITAAIGDLTDFVRADIPRANPTLSAIRINEQLPTSGSVKLTVNGVYSDGSSALISSGITWISSNARVAIVDGIGNVVFTGNGGDVTITASYNDKQSSVSTIAQAVPISLTNLVIRGLPAFSQPGATYMVSVQAIYGSNYVENLSNRAVTFASSRPDIAAINSDGLITINGSEGYFWISATYQDKIVYFTSTIGFYWPSTGYITTPTIANIKIMGDIPSEPFQPRKLELKSLLTNGFYGSISGNATWTTSNKNVVDVRSDGTIYFGGQYGVANITVKYDKYEDNINIRIDKSQQTYEEEQILFLKEAKMHDAQKAFFDENVVHENEIIDTLDQLKSLSQRTNLQGFKDTKGHWGERELKLAKELGIISGDSSGNFRPNDRITRAEFAVMICKAFSMSHYIDDVDKTFKDVSGKWYEDDIMALKNSGIINGYPDGTFRPNNNISRGEMAAIISKLIVKKEITYKNSSKKYMDIGSKYWAKKDIDKLYSLNALDMIGKNMFEPNRNTTRAEVVYIIINLFDNIYKDSTQNF